MQGGNVVAYRTWRTTAEACSKTGLAKGIGGTPSSQGFIALVLKRIGQVPFCRCLSPAPNPAKGQNIDQE